MKIKLATSALALTLLLPAAAVAQVGDYAQVIEVDATSPTDFENHFGMFRNWSLDQGNDWTWLAFEVIMGERTGQYVFGSFNHDMADWDAPPVDMAASREQQLRHIAPYTDSYRGGMMRNRRELSTQAADAPIRPIYQVITFDVKLGKEEAFMEVLGALKNAVEAASAPIEFNVFQTFVGSNGSQFIVSVPFANFAAMEPGADDGFETLMEGVYGEFHSDTMMDLFNASVITSKTELFVLRPDLSMNLPGM